MLCLLLNLSRLVVGGGSFLNSLTQIYAGQDKRYRCKSGEWLSDVSADDKNNITGGTRAQLIRNDVCRRDIALCFHLGDIMKERFRYINHSLDFL